MGGNFWTSTAAAWTFLYLVQVLSADRSLFQDLGLNLPDVTKINVSQDEYTRMMTVYLDSRRHSSADTTSIPELVTFYIAKNDWWQGKGDATRLKFSVRHSNQEMDVDSAQLRLLVPPLVPHPATSVQVQVYQVLGMRRRRLIDDRILHLSENSTKWCELDVGSAVQSWMNGERNLGLELVCVDCDSSLRPLEAAISTLVYPEHRRFRRSSSPYHPSRRTDCRESRRGNGKKRCCRHNMTVKFSELIFPEMGSIVQPKAYEAGYCQGQCPPNYNHATNHSRIQSLIHQMDRKNAKRLNRRAIPKACCAPSKLEPLEILRVNPVDTSRLMVEKWDNMQVIECACS